MEKIEKPISVAKEDLRAILIHCIRTSSLPPCVSVDVVEKVFMQVKQLAYEEYEKENSEYQRLLLACNSGENK